MDNFFEVKNVDFIIDGKTKVKNMSFSIKKEGDIVCLLGPSGIGKTTLLHLLAGILKPESGSISISGTDISKFSDTELDKFRGDNIGIVFQ
mgnify:CR=1 FL=1